MFLCINDKVIFPYAKQQENVLFVDCLLISVIKAYQYSGAMLTVPGMHWHLKFQKSIYILVFDGLIIGLHRWPKLDKTIKGILTMDIKPSASEGRQLKKPSNFKDAPDG